MNRTIRFVGLVLASLTISTVAMAQQGGGNGGGGRGGDGGGNGGSSGGGDPSILQVLRENEASKARLTRAIERRGSPNCITHACSEEPPPPRRPRQPPIERHEMAQADAACAGGEVFAVRSRGGMIIRYFCEMP